MSVLTRCGNHTEFSLIAYSDPGGGLPNWAVRSVVGTLVGIEPFRFFHRVAEGARRKAEGAGINQDGKVRVGISQMGYAGFWEMPEVRSIVMGRPLFSQDSSLILLLTQCLRSTQKWGHGEGGIGPDATTGGNVDAEDPS